VSQPDEAAPSLKSHSPYPWLSEQSRPWDGRDYFKRGRGGFKYDRPQRWPYRWSLLVVPFVMCVILLLAAALTVGRRFYQSYPVSAANPVFKAASHATFNNDCSRCHTEPFRTVRRLCPGNDELRTVADGACNHCHRPIPREEFCPEDLLAASRNRLEGPPALVHHTQQISAQVPACAACHREHRGELTLKHVADDYCVDCHGCLRRRDGKPPTCLSPVTSFVGGHPSFRFPSDRGRLRFNHELHAGRDLLRTDGNCYAMECQACHKKDPVNGRYMLPVSYARNCRECHPLTLPLLGQWQDEGLRTAGARFMREPVTHGRLPEEVRGELRGRYTDFIRKNPGALESPVQAAPMRPVPGQRSSPGVNTEEAWVAVQAETAERALFQHLGGCRYCHEPAEPVVPRSLPKYLPTDLRARWLSRSVFSHSRHESMKCTDCHATALCSRQTSDILMPTIDICQRCHNAPTAPGARGGSDCISCHRYHDLFNEQ
jgi:Cytochrome c7 and related cytochrome c